ncbi:hypothetical protein KUTeg_020555 [Tegillarca granosa]|uniref:Metallo-beta-lactamase domain-containing protein n=1 Tax=Tegillarca granosa TaxID=220873 RepID=A0ABQ9E881_TEGGR|nr:hypothetical protein KUTeg_020555 [Tegillarca granosa]
MIVSGKLIDTPILCVYICVSFRNLRDTDSGFRESTMGSGKTKPEIQEPESSTNEGYTQPLFDEKSKTYKNPWKTWSEPQFTNVLKFIWGETDHSNIPETRVLDKELPVLTPDFARLKSFPKSGVQMMWIGHASVLVQFDGISVLTDPVFSQRASPLQIMGPKRYRPPPCKIEELPHVDAVVISHNHYDHLDYGSVKKLNAKFGDKLWWYVPAGTKQWMVDTGCSNVVELSWWEESKYPNDPKISFALWGSWVVKGPNHSFYFAGDTGYCEGFKQIGRKYGPITSAAIPIGAYEPSKI